MCGVLAVISNSQNKVEVKPVLEAAKLMEYRGPDNTGHFQTDDQTSVLVHKRLTIIDLSAQANQPMTSDLGNVIVFNGEIYNFQELKKELESKGISFSTQSDTEVLLKSYEYWGEEVLEKLDGMYAFVIFDKKQKRFFAANDRFGIKPLFIHQSSSQTIISSAVLPIAKILRKVTLQARALSNFIYLGWDPTGETLLKEVMRVPPGSCIIHEQGRKAIVKQYYSHMNVWKEPQSDRESNDLDQAISSSVRQTMTSDVPLGLFLSGGVDSSLIAAKMSLFERAFPTYSMHFEDESLDESQYARGVSKYLGTNHHEIETSNEDFAESTFNFLRNIDYPVADTAALPLYHLANVASSQIKVCLSGDGGDELFRGYSLHNLPKKVRALLEMPRFFKDAFGKLLCLFPTSKAQTLQKLLFGKTRLDSYFRLRQNERYSFNEIPFLPNENSKYESLGLEEAYNLLDLNHYLPYCLLPKTDLATMLSSIEGRLPLLNYKVYQASLAIPFDQRRSKIDLRLQLERHIPKSLWDHPKHGFEVPVAKWLQEDFSWMLDLIAKNDYLNSVIDVNAALTSFAKQSFKFEDQAWTLLVLDKWLNHLSSICQVDISKNESFLL